MYLLLFLLSFAAVSGTESANLYEQSYPRDNAFCMLNKKRIEIQIRGMNKFTEPAERGYGEYIFFRLDRNKPKLMELNKLRSDSFRFFSGISPVCSKNHGYKVDPTTVALLFLKENRPFKDKLVIQLFDTETLRPKETLETEYMSDKAKKMPDGFAFSTFRELHNPEIGKVTIDGNSYIYQEKDFAVWVRYSKTGFEQEPELTFERFNYKKVFPRKEDFLDAAGWNKTEKKFTRLILYHATNHALKMSCILLIESKQKPLGNEAWKCQTI